MTFEERACVFFANEDYSKIRYHFFPIDTSYFLTIKYANRLDSNLFVFSIGKQQVNNLSDFTTEIILTDSVGNVLKSNEFSSFNRFVFCNSVLKSEGSYYAVFNKVFLDNIYNPTDLIIYKLDSNLVIRDYYMTQDNRWYNSAASLILPNGNLVVAGVYVDSLGQGGDLWQNKYLSCFDSDLNLLWTKVFGRWSLNTLVSKIMLSQDGNIIGCGSGLFPIEKDSAGMHLTGCLFKFTPEGEELWVKNYQGINNDVYGDLNELISLDEFPDGSIVACGNAITFTPYMQRGWLIKVNSAGDLLFNTVTPDTLTNANSDFVLYPNPSSDFIDVKFDKKTLSEYRLIDLKGKIIDTGTQFPISISHLSEGVYFLELNLIHAPKKRLRFIKN